MERLRHRAKEKQARGRKERVLMKDELAIASLEVGCATLSGPEEEFVSDWRSLGHTRDRAEGLLHVREGSLPPQKPGEPEGT